MRLITALRVLAMVGLISVLTCALIAACGLTQFASAYTPEVSPLYWAYPTSVEHSGDSPVGWLNGVSCPSTSLCVATDAAGDVVTSTDPTGGASAWTVANVGGGGLRFPEVGSVSCPSTSLCVAVDGRRAIMTSADPTGGAGAWEVAAVDSTHTINGVSCASERLCVAVDDGGDVLTSIDPTGGTSAWVITNVDGARGIGSVSCVSASLCVATDGENVLTSTDPTGGAGAWKAANVSTTSINDVSCTSGPLCVASTENKSIMTSTDPTGGASAWTTGAEHVDGSGGISCASAALCVAVTGDTNSGLWTSTEPTGGTDGWTQARVGPASFGGVSCPSVSLCVAVDHEGNVVVGTQAYDVSVSLLGAGKGTVTSTPIKCPFTCSYPGPGFEPQPITAIYCLDIWSWANALGTCSLSYPAGDAITVTASPAAGSTFAGWGGACNGSASCSLTTDTDQAVSATFSPSDPGSATKTTKASCVASLISPKISMARVAISDARKHSHAGLAVTVRCDQNARVSVTGHVTVSSKRKARSAGGKGRVTATSLVLPRITGAVRANQSKEMMLIIPSRALKKLLMLLGKHDRLSATIKLTATNANGSTTVRTTVRQMSLPDLLTR